MIYLSFFLLNQQVVPLKETTCFTPRNASFLLKEHTFPSWDV
ncbi:hypothetical protein BSCG_03887 [Bacteroides sp. 2_2_4]|nr:hypothetical protein BSCG_03887 [Bacteroides sp. 2_2_4]